MAAPLSLALLCPLLRGAAASQLVLHVSPNGSDAASGSASAPLASCAGAVGAMQAALNQSGLPEGGVEVRFARGTYPLTANTSCGTLSFKGTEASPIVFRGSGAPGSVIFDGSEELDSAGLGAVTNATVLPLLNPAAKGKVKVLHVGSKWGGGELSWNGVPLTSSQWPNQGLGYVRKVLDAGAIYADGRTKGPKPHCHVCLGDNKSTAAAPCGANISLLQQPTGDWEAELAAGPGFGSLTLSGYLSADWYHESHRIARVYRTATNTSLQFADSSRYGICEALEMSVGGCAGSAPGRFIVSGLLSEVDSPGEMYFDSAAHNLYVYPVDDSDKVRLSFQAGPGLFSLSDSTWVTVRDFVITGSSGGVGISGGENNTIGGCTVRNSGGGISLSGGYRNRVIGNDILDVGTHIATSGNDADGLSNLKPTNNLCAASGLASSSRLGLGPLILAVDLTQCREQPHHECVHGRCGLPGPAEGHGRSLLTQSRELHEVPCFLRRPSSLILWRPSLNSLTKNPAARCTTLQAR